MTYKRCIFISTKCMNKFSSGKVTRRMIHAFFSHHFLACEKGKEVKFRVPVLDLTSSIEVFLSDSGDTAAVKRVKQMTQTNATGYETTQTSEIRSTRLRTQQTCFHDDITRRDTFTSSSLCVAQKTESWISASAAALAPTKSKKKEKIIDQSLVSTNESIALSTCSFFRRTSQ